MKTATVVKVNAANVTCDLLCPDGKVLYSVPIANTSGGMFSNEASLDKNYRGAVVYYAFFDGQPYILGTLPQPVQPKTDTSLNTSNTETGASNKQTYGATGGATFSGGRQSDITPNDKVLSADGGASITLMSEGGVVLKASPMAQLIMGAGMDFLRMVARELQIFTDFGELVFSHGSSGRTGLTIKGGAVYSDEAQSGPGVNTVFMHLGETEGNPNSRFGVRVTDTEAGNYGAFCMEKDGKVMSACSSDYHTSVGGEIHTMCDMDEYHQVGMNQGVEVGINRRLNVKGDDATYVYKNRCVAVAMDEDHGVARDFNLQVGGTITVGCAGLTFQSKQATGGQKIELECSSLNIKKA